jgi:hypothetical protein
MLPERALSPSRFFKLVNACWLMSGVDKMLIYSNSARCKKTTQFSCSNMVLFDKT